MTTRTTQYPQLIVGVVHTSRNLQATKDLLRERSSAAKPSSVGLELSRTELFLNRSWIGRLSAKRGGFFMDIDEFLRDLKISCVPLDDFVLHAKHRRILMRALQDGGIKFPIDPRILELERKSDELTSKRDIVMLKNVMRKKPEIVVVGDDHARYVYRELSGMGLDADYITVKYGEVIKVS